MDGEVRARRVTVVFAIGLVVVAGTLYLWWPAGVVIGIVLASAATVVIGRRLQAQAAAAPIDQDLLDLLELQPTRGSTGVVRTVLAPDAATGRGRASIR